MNWRAISIGDLVDAKAADIQTGPFGTQLKASDYVEEGTPVINVRNIGFGGLRPEKLEFVSDDAAAALEPTDEQLQGFLQQHADKFLQPGRLSFQQLQFSVERRGEAARHDAEKVLGQLQAGRGPADPAQAGDATLLPAGLDDASPQDIASAFGEDFAGQIDKAPVGQWSGPLQSSYGWHIVRVTARTPAVAPTLEQVRPIVLREWQFEQNQKQSGEFYQSLRKQYDVRVEGELGVLLEKYQAAGSEAAR